jgi:hypothetical protein
MSTAVWLVEKGKGRSPDTILYKAKIYNLGQSTSRSTAGSKLLGRAQKPTFVFSHPSPEFCGIVLRLPHAHTVTWARVDNLT